MEHLSREFEQKETALSNDQSEREIRTIINEFHSAVLARDVDKIMSFYSEDVVAFDMIPPLQFVGKEAYRKSWEKAFEEAQSDKNSGYDLQNLKIVAGNNIAFCHELNHCFGNLNGEKMDMWMRGTHCFKKIKGQWLIVHEQFSIPVDFESGMGVMDLRPEKMLH